jgi:hypothetical protein
MACEGGEAGEMPASTDSYLSMRSSPQSIHPARFRRARCGRLERQWRCWLDHPSSASQR